MTRSEREVKCESSPKEPKTVIDHLMEQANAVLSHANGVSAKVAVAVDILVGPPQEGAGVSVSPISDKGALGQLSIILADISRGLNTIDNDIERLK